MMQHLRAGRKGFTLVELAIVLAVAGVLFVGLWRLLSGGNQQVRDQSAASQQLQLINAVKAYLSSANGQNQMKAVAASTEFDIALPTTAPDGATNTACKGTIGNADNKFLCDYLPIGFSTATTNSYGQTYAVHGIKDNSAAGTAPNSYSFMILTFNGDTIPDSSGGRIAAAIGGDGGFVYTTSVCGAGLACGAYGTWTADPTGAAGNASGKYGFGTFGTNYFGGHVASRSFMSAYADSTTPWLERKVQLPDTNFSYNTMTTNLYIGRDLTPTQYNIYMAPAGTTTGGGNIYMNRGSINLGPDTGVINGGVLNAQAGTINMQAGPINMQTGSLYMNVSGTGTNGGNIYLQGGSLTDNVAAGAVGSIFLHGTMSAGVATSPALRMVSDCAKANQSDSSCQYIAQFSGDVNVTNLLNATSLYAGTFIYQSSDLRLKTNIRPLHNALDDLARLKPVSFNFKLNGQAGLGFIAQDVEKVYPDLVTKNQGMKAVNYEGIIAPLVEAVQELKKENEDLRHKLDVQEARQEKLERGLRQDRQSP